MADDGIKTYRHHSDPQGEASRLERDLRDRGVKVSANPQLKELRGELNDMMTYGPSVQIRSKWS